MMLNLILRAVRSAFQSRQSLLLENTMGLLATAVTTAPFLGLLGTVWGMIIAFHDSTLAAENTDMATELAEGIYTALVTTMAGSSRINSTGAESTRTV